MRTRIVGLALAACLPFASASSEEAAPVSASQESSPEAPKRPRVILVFSGGGARGSAHIGVLKVLEEYHVPVDMIVGTSMGSIIAGLYASGWSSEDIDTKITGLDWGSVFVDKLPRQEKTFRRKEDDARFLIPIKMRFKNWKPYLPPAVIGGENMQLLFEGLVTAASGEHDFDKFPIPYRAVATDLANGNAVIIGSGSLSAAMRASMSLPGIFPPVDLNGKTLADGGMAANFPIRIARALGADVIIGVDITSPLRKKEELGNLLTRIDQVTGLLTNANKEADYAATRPSDIILVPDLGDITFSDFAKAKETIVRGEVAARDAEARLRKLSVSDAEWNAYMERHHRRSEASLVVDQVVIENTGPLTDAIVDRCIDIPKGTPLVVDDLSKQITRLYGLDVFGPITYDFERIDDQGKLTIRVPPKPYGKNSLQFGFFLASDFNGDLDFDLTLSHLLLPVNRQGGEWRNIVQLGTNTLVATEFYQPMDPAMAWVFEARADYRRDMLSFFDTEGNAIAQYVFETAELGFGFGRVFGRWGALTVGPFAAWGEGRLRIGVQAFPNADTDDGGVGALFKVDTLDSVTWPRSGTHAQVQYRRSFSSMGAQQDGDFASASVGKAIDIGKNIIFLSAEASDVFDGAVAIDNVYTLGGFLHLSGLQPYQLVGSRGGLARFMYYRELTSFSLGSLTQRMYAGFSAEVGNTYNSGDVVNWASLRLAGSVYVGADTVLGPAYLGYGYEESGQTAAYLIIGQRF
jgi:NTE family protein